MYNISNCTKCKLCDNQPPLLDKVENGDVLWMGLSAKIVKDIKNECPLSANTNSGKIINAIENDLPHVYFYKTNLVKCVPLDDNKKIRYPLKHEMQSCFKNFEIEIDTIKPKIIFMLGKVVSDFVAEKLGLGLVELNDDFKYNIYKGNGNYFVPVHHPSYIHIYKRKSIENYMNGIKDIIEDKFKA